MLDPSQQKEILIIAWQDNQDILLGHLKDILKITSL